MFIGHFPRVYIRFYTTSLQPSVKVGRYLSLLFGRHRSSSTHRHNTGSPLVFCMPPEADPLEAIQIACVLVFSSGNRNYGIPWPAALPWDVCRGSSRLSFRASSLSCLDGDASFMTTVSHTARLLYSEKSTNSTAARGSKQARELSFRPILSAVWRIGLKCTASIKL